MDHGISGVKRPFKFLANVFFVVALMGIGAAWAQDGEPVHTHTHIDEAAEAVFRDHISGPIVQSKCVYCHVEGGVSGHTRLVFARAADAPDHEAFNLHVFADFLGAAEHGHEDHDREHGPERILTKIQGAGHGGGVQVPVGSDDFDNMDRFLALLDGHSQGFVARLLEGLDDGDTSLLFAITTPADEETVAGNAVTVSAIGAPTEAVHLAYRPAGDSQDGFAYLGAAVNGAAARYAWNTSDMMDGDYELAALFTEDGGDSITRDLIHVTVDNVDPAQPPDIVEDSGYKTQALRMGERHEIITADGVTVTLPPGALDADDRITITVVASLDPETAPGDAVGVGVDVSLDSGQTAFREAATIALPYPEGKPDGIVHNTDIPETDLSLWFFNAEADAWEMVAGAMVQPDAGVVVADVTQTGEFAIFHAPMAMAEPNGEDVTEPESDAAARGDDGGGGGCTMLPMVPPGPPDDPTLIGLLGLVTVYLIFGRRRLRRQVAMG